MIIVNLPQNPIFVVGYPRSGTTLVQSLIATQRGIVSFPEGHFFSEIIEVVQLTPNGFIPTTNMKPLFERIRSKIGLEFDAATKEQLNAMSVQQAALNR